MVAGLGRLLIAASSVRAQAGRSVSARAGAGRRRAPAATRAALRARSCRGCHSEAHADWAPSRHGLAWTNAIFQREYKDRPLEWCVHCHAPLREQLAEVRRGGGAARRRGRQLRRLPRPRRADAGARPRARRRRTTPTCAPTSAGPRTAPAATSSTFRSSRRSADKGPGAHRLHASPDAGHRQPARARAASQQECLGCHQRERAAHRFPGRPRRRMIDRR